MMRSLRFEYQNSLESLELKLSPSSVGVSGLLVSPVVRSLNATPMDDDPLPEPEPAPQTDPGPFEPIDYPPAPPSGPIGPG